MARSKEMDLTTGNPFRSLLKFAIPVILGNLFQLFYTLADSVIVGKTLGADSLAAVGSTSIIIYFVFCFINGFTGGFGICLGQKCGAKDEKGMRKSVAVSTLLSIAFTVVLTLTCCLLSHQILRWMQIPADISGEAYDYMFVVLLGTGATVFYNMISNMLRALGDSKTPLYFLVFSSVLNIFLDIQCGRKTPGEGKKLSFRTVWRRCKRRQRVAFGAFGRRKKTGACRIPICRVCIYC